MRQNPPIQSDTPNAVALVNFNFCESKKCFQLSPPHLVIQQSFQLLNGWDLLDVHRIQAELIEHSEYGHVVADRLCTWCWEGGRERENGENSGVVNSLIQFWRDFSAVNRLQLPKLWAVYIRCQGIL